VRLWHVHHVVFAHVVGEDEDDVGLGGYCLGLRLAHEICHPSVVFPSLCSIIPHIKAVRDEVRMYLRGPQEYI
jgi:hypothetical protein